MRDDELMLPPGTFFPTDTPKGEQLDRTRIERFSTFMTEADEPSLLKMASSPENHAYRFLWTRALFLSGPVLIRFTIQPDGTALAVIKIWKQVPMNDSRKPYPEYRAVIGLKTQKAISKRHVDEFLHRLDKATFWQMPTKDHRLGLDGETWDIEAVKSGKFHYVTRWVPEDKAYIEIGLLLLRICKLQSWHRLIGSINRKSDKDWSTRGIELMARLVILLGYRPRER